MPSGKNGSEVDPLLGGGQGELFGRPPRINGHTFTAYVDDQIVESFILRDGTEYGISAAVARELERLYPNVDVWQTMREIRAWTIAHPGNRKTRVGAMAFLNGWLKREQAKSN